MAFCHWARSDKSFSASFFRINPFLTGVKQMGVRDCHETCGDRKTTIFTSKIHGSDSRKSSEHWLEANTTDSEKWKMKSMFVFAVRYTHRFLKVSFQVPTRTLTNCRRARTLEAQSWKFAPIWCLKVRYRADKDMRPTSAFTTADMIQLPRSTQESRHTHFQLDQSVKWRRNDTPFTPDDDGGVWECPIEWTLERIWVKKPLHSQHLGFTQRRFLRDLDMI